MTRVDSDAWIPKAKKRKAYRDHHRNKFFREVGLIKGADVQDITGAPHDGVSFVAELLDLTAAGSVPDPVHAATMAAMKGALMTAGLGIGQMGGVSETMARLDQYSLPVLRRGWFRSPAFID